MAKKETTTAATVASKAAAKVAAEVLKANPDINEVHVTSDGTAFYTRNAAQNYARTLKNREVFSFKRESSAPARSKKSDTPTTSDIPAASNQEVDELTCQPIEDTSDVSIDATTNTGK